MTIHSCAYPIWFTRANMKVTFLPEHRYEEFKTPIFLPRRQSGLFPACPFCSFLPLQLFHYTERFQYQTLHYYLRANTRAKRFDALHSPAENHAAIPPADDWRGFAGCGEAQPIPPHMSLCAPRVVHSRSAPARSPPEPPLPHALTQATALLRNSFIRLFSILGCGNYSVNYSQHNKILIMHSYFGLRRDMIIQPQNQGHV